MDSTKYVGMDVHKEAISVAVMNSSGRVVMESILETKASTLVQFVQGLRGDLQVTFGEGTWAAWLYDTDRQGPGRLLAEKINRSLRQRSWNNLFPFPINRLCGHSSPILIQSLHSLSSSSARRQVQSSLCNSTGLLILTSQYRQCRPVSFDPFLMMVLSSSKGNRKPILARLVRYSGQFARLLALICSHLPTELRQVPRPASP
jgi:hypothetical protein